MLCGSGFAGSSVIKYTVVLAVVLWTVYATTWLISLTTSGHCPTARSTVPVSSMPPEGVVAATTTTFAPPAPASQLLTETVEERTLKAHQHYSAEISRNVTGKCTLVMLTFRRQEILPKVLLHYCKVEVLERILVIWNDVNTTVPQNILDITYGCVIDLKFIRSKENLLTNRYLPREEIDTDCVCLMDDDRIISVEDMKFGFEVWKNFRHRIVGFEERSFIKKNGKYIYTNYERRRFFSVKTEKSQNTNRLPPGYRIEIKDGVRILHVKNKTFVLGKADANTNLKGSTIMRQSEYSSSNESQKSEGYNIMLNSCFIHRAYLEMYFDPMMVPLKLLEYVNERRNCEDILMSVVATKFLNDIHQPQCGVLAVKASWIDNLEEEAHEQGGREGLSTRADHYKGRSQCLEKFATEYGYLPLHLSKIVMSKVSYHL